MPRALKEVPQMTDGTQDEDEVGGILEYSVPIEEQERPPVLPIGDYRATITGVELKHGKDSGRPYLNVKFTVGPDDQPADFVEELGTGQPINVFYMLFGAENTPPSRFQMRQFCEALGAPMGREIPFKQFLNLEARVSIEHQNDLHGNAQPRVRRVNKV